VPAAVDATVVEDVAYTTPFVFKPENTGEFTIQVGAELVPFELNTYPAVPAVNHEGAPLVVPINT